MLSRFRNDFYIAIALAAAALLTRIPFRSLTINSWDSVSFALGLERFNISEQQPQPPGYVLYETAGRILNLFFHNANNSLVALSILSATVAVVLIYFIGLSMFERSTGLVAAIVLLVSPLNWYYGEVALTYEIELPLMIMAGWLLYQLYFHRRYAVLAAVFIGLAGGFRQDILLFLGPFLLVGVAGLKRREALLALAALAGSVLAWLLPLVFLAGGIFAFLDATQVQYELAIQPYTVFSGGWHAFSSNLRGVWQYSVWFLGAAGVALLYMTSYIMSPARGKDGRRMLFLSILIVPALLYFLLFQIAQPGYILAIAGPLALIIARLITVTGNGLIASPEKSLATGRIFLIANIIFITLINPVLFIRADRIEFRLPYTEGAFRNVLGPYSAGGIESTDSQTQADVAAIRQFSPQSTSVIVGVLADWRRLMYYLPEYDIYIFPNNAVPSYSRYHHHFNVVTNDRIIKVDPHINQFVFVNFMPSGIAGLENVPLPIEADILVKSAPLPETGLTVGEFSLQI